MPVWGRQLIEQAVEAVEPLPEARLQRSVFMNSPSTSVLCSVDLDQKTADDFDPILARY